MLPPDYQEQESLWYCLTHHPAGYELSLMPNLTRIENGPDNKKNPDREREQKAREIIGGISATLVWFFVDLTFVWPESHERAYGFGFLFVVAQIVQITQVRLRTTVRALIAWTLIAAIGYHFIPPTPPEETETQKWLVPANDPSPTNICINPTHHVPPDAQFFFFGPSVVQLTPGRIHYVLIQMNNKPFLSIDNTTKGIALNGDIFDSIGNLVAHVFNNEVTLVPGEYSRTEKPDDSTLIVYDRQNKELLYIRYLNKFAVRIRGVFPHADKRPPVTITDDSIIVGGWATGGNCFVDVGIMVAF